MECAESPKCTAQRRVIVLYYSNDILGRALPELGPYISLGITVVNVIMTFAPIILIEVSGQPFHLHYNLTSRYFT